MSFEEKNIDDRVFHVGMLARVFLNVACDEVDLQRANIGQTPIRFSSVHLEPLSTRFTYYVGDEVGRVSVQLQPELSSLRLNYANSVQRISFDEIESDLDAFRDKINSAIAFQMRIL